MSHNESNFVLLKLQFSIVIQIAAFTEKVWIKQRLLPTLKMVIASSCSQNLLLSSMKNWWALMRFLWILFSGFLTRSVHVLDVDYFRQEWKKRFCFFELFIGKKLHKVFSFLEKRPPQQTVSQVLVHRSCLSRLKNLRRKKQ